MNNSDIIIKVDNLYKSFSSNRVLCGLDLEIKKGESIVILGGSGTGKSVLIKNIIGLIKPDSGSIYLFGEDSSGFSNDKWKRMRNHFGMLFQGAALFDSMNVEENIGFGLKRQGRLSALQIKERVLECLRLVGLREDIVMLSPSELSGGMKKRVGLARAIAFSPDILLYDEPTTGLDPIMSDVINKLIVNLTRKLHVTSISITHDLKSAYTIGDRIGMLYKGRIIEIGSPEEIKNSKNPVVYQFINGLSEGPYEI